MGSLVNLWGHWPMGSPARARRSMGSEHLGALKPRGRPWFPRLGSIGAPLSSGSPRLPDRLPHFRVGLMRFFFWNLKGWFEGFKYSSSWIGGGLNSTSPNSATLAELGGLTQGGRPNDYRSSGSDESRVGKTEAQGVP